MRTTLPAEDFLPPLVPARAATAAEIPAAADRFATAARAAGWTVVVTYARGYTPDASWQPKPVRVEEEVVGEDGTPELTPTGRPRVRKVATGQLEVVETIAVRARRGQGPRVAALWVDGAFEAAYASHPLRILGSGAALALVRELGVAPRRPARARTRRHDGARRAA